jgi:hypothetical protein
MDQTTLTIRRYLAPLPGTFWHWGDAGTVVAWRDGETIAFRSEVVTVLGRLAKQGLPHMDAVVLFLAACRGPQRSDGGELLTHEMFRQIRETQGNSSLFQDIAATLRAIAELSGEIRHAPGRKAELAELVFEASEPALPSELAARVLFELNRGFGNELLSPQSDVYAPELLFRLKGLAAGSGRIDAPRVNLRHETGLDTLPQAAEEADAEGETFADLLRALEGDEELAGMIRLTRQLMAALTLPRAISEPQDLPLGGVSDITNRGSFDRLLVSELAHDDLSFVVRVALNEALYLRREAPPNVPPRKRLILIDSGIRLWGVPRVFATAAALALAGTRRRHDELTVFRPRDGNLDRVDLLGRAGLQAHLAALEPHAHPGAALPTFERIIAADKSVGEAVLVTGEDVVADKAFRRALAMLAIPVYIVTVHRQGRMQLHRRSPQGMKLLRETRYELDRILAPQRRVSPLIDPTVNASLPAILRLSNFPLLLPHHVDPHRIWGDSEGLVLCLSTDQRLTLWQETRFAARQLSDSIPPGRLHWHSAHFFGRRTCAVVGRMSQNGLFLLQVDLQDEMCRVLPLALQDPAPQAVAAHSEAVFVICQDNIEVFSQEDGEPLSSVPRPPHLRWQRDRFFCEVPPGSRVQTWYALAYDGRAAVFEKLGVAEQSRDADPIIAVFDVVHIDGPVGVTRKGEFRYFYDIKPATGLPRQWNPATELRTRPRFNFGAVEANGRSLVLKPLGEQAEEGNSQERAFWLFDLVSGKVTLQSAADAVALLKQPLQKIAMPRRNLRTRFIGVTARSGELILKPMGDKSALAVVINIIATDGEELHWDTRPRVDDSKLIRFEDVPSPPGTGYRLSVARWKDGSAAFLDSRGLLHLKSSDFAIPEATLILGEHSISGWCADGRVWGSDYFIGDVDRENTLRMYQDVIKPFVMRLP